MSFRGILGGILGMAIVAAALALAVHVFANAIFVSRLDREMANLRANGATKATYETASVDLLSRSATVRGIDIRLRDKDTIRIGAVDVLSYDILNYRRPQYGEMTVSGLSLSAGDGSELSALLRQVGLNSLNGGVRLAFDANHKLRIFNIKRLDLAIRELGDLSVTGKLGNLNRSTLTALARAIAGAGTAAFKGNDAEIHYATIAYRDRGFVNRYLKFRAERDDTSLTKYKRALQRDLRKVRKQIKGPRFQKERDLIATIITFIGRPRALTVKLEPDNPVKFVDLPGLEDPVRLRSRLRPTLSLSRKQGT